MIRTAQNLTSFRVRVVVEGKQGDACLALGAFSKDKWEEKNEARKLDEITREQTRAFSPG